MQKRVCVVTGGTGGIGTAICHKLAEGGLEVVATHLPSERAQAQAWQEEQAARGSRVGIAEVDVCSFDSCARMAAKVKASHGAVSVLVNAAGITDDSTLRNMDREQWRKVLVTNLDSVYNVTKHVIDDMVSEGYGRIVNIASVNGKKGQFGQTNYAAAKAGIHGFTMSLAQEVAAKGVTVNTISPGYIATSMLDAIDAEILESIVSNIPVRRLGRPDEVARVVEFLVDQDCGFITGANIDVNGGMWMH